MQGACAQLNRLHLEVGEPGRHRQLNEMLHVIFVVRMPHDLTALIANRVEGISRTFEFRSRISPGQPIPQRLEGSPLEVSKPTSAATPLRAIGLKS